MSKQLELDPVISIGYTGTRYGMSNPQQIQTLSTIHTLCLGRVHSLVAHHGGCRGGDEEFHEIVLGLNESFRAVIHVWPGPEDVDRLHPRYARKDVIIHDPMSHMRRNKRIVHESIVMIGAPLNDDGLGGTWRTIGFARKAQRELFQINRDGSVTK